MMYDRSSVPPHDCTLVVVTPENVRFDYRLAGPFSRLLALILDYIFVGLICFIFFALLSLTIGAASMGVVMVTYFILQWGFTALSETLFNGLTFGKRALSMRVVSENGLPINAQQAFLRGFLRTADLLPNGLAGVFSMLLSRNFQRLGDLAAGTVVIVEGKQGRVLAPPAVAVPNLSPEIIPLKFRPNPALTEAITSYMARRSKLSKPRCREIAWYLARHFIRSWSLPEMTDPDELLCLIYQKVVAAEHETKQKTHSVIIDSETPDYLLNESIPQAEGVA